jgi:hypothetical protein
LIKASGTRPDPRTLPVSRPCPVGFERGWVYQGGGDWKPDRESEPVTDLTALLALAGDGTEITFTAVLEGEEYRLGVERDEDTSMCSM